MKIRELMSSQAFACRPQDSLATAASLLWQHDCGILPVVDGQGRVGATITDRDVCMGAMMGGRKLDELPVADSMSRGVVSCTADEEVDDVARRMCEHQLHRLPVVDGYGKLAGMLTLNDLVTAGDHDAKVGALARQILTATCRHRSQVPAVLTGEQARPEQPRPGRKSGKVGKTGKAADSGRF